MKVSRLIAVTVAYLGSIGLVSASASEVNCGLHLMFGNPGGVDQVLCRTGYAVGYSYAHKGPSWVAYSITSASVYSNYAVERQDDFRSDAEIPEDHRGTPEDYEEPVFDRGHMADSAVIDFTVTANSETFLMSNMTPQIPEMNRAVFGKNGAWGALEHKIRSWIKMRGHLYVIAGALYGDGTDTIGDGVGVPEFLYKIVVDVRTANAIAFLFPAMDENTGGDLSGYIRSVDELEEITGLDYLTDLADEVEYRVESASEQVVWKSRTGQ